MQHNCNDYRKKEEQDNLTYRNRSATPQDSTYILQHKKLLRDLERYINLAAVISSQTVKHERGDTSGKHEATTAKRDQRKSFALTRSAPPGFFSFSHSARSPKSSTGIILLLSVRKEISLPLPIGVKFVVELAFFFDSCILLRTVTIWILRRGSVNSFDA